MFDVTSAQSLKEHLQKGDRFYQRKDFASAIINYREALKTENSDAQLYYKAGISCLNEELFTEALAYLEKAHTLDPQADQQISYHLAQAYQHTHQYRKAIEHYSAFSKRYKGLAGVASQRIKECALADSLMQIPAYVTVRLMEDVNTTFSEYHPLFSADGNMMVFTSDRTDDGYEIKSRTYTGDVYIRKKLNGTWTSPEKISQEINRSGNEAAVFLSPEGTTLLLYYEEGNGDLYTSTFSGEWSLPEPLNRFVNHPHFRESSACLSPDGKNLFFSSNRPGGKGGYDIYVCELGANGQWGRPKNLGAPVNTRGDEEYPFLHEDGSLYFSSNGHATLGGLDIYRSMQVEGSWTSPKHMGYPLNTRGFEGGFYFSPDKRHGYFSSRRGNEPGNSNLYCVTFDQHPLGETTTAGLSASSGSVALRETSGPEIHTLLKGTVIDVKKTTPLEATLRLVDNTNNMVISTITTDPSGTFELVIPQSGNYGLTTEKPGYLFNSIHFDLPPFKKFQEIETHILMVKAEVGSKVVLKNIFFDLNEADLKPESLSELQTIKELLVRNPQWRIQINGHTDNTGNAATNLALSHKRAEAVVQYLIAEGIPARRLKAKGYGSEKPLVSNDDEREGRQINRRTEIEIIE